MMVKDKGAIEAITLNTATYVNCTVNLAPLNFFFGRNGVGKSTLTRALQNCWGLTWRDADGNQRHNILVYNREFVDENFADYGTLKGVFTLGKHNAETQKQIESLQAKREALNDDLQQTQGEINKLEQANADSRDRFVESCWSATSQIRTVFEQTQKGYKYKNPFATHITEVGATEHDITELQTLYTVAFDKTATPYPPLACVTFSLPDDSIMGEPIIGTGQSTFSRFIEQLHAADWVQYGYQHYVSHSDNQCPFCQQALPADFTARIQECFDTAYQENIDALGRFAQAYKNEAKRIQSLPQSRELVSTHPDMDTDRYDQALSLLQSKLASNVQTIDKKIANPSQTFQLEDLNPTLDAVNAAIAETNELIDQHNSILANQKQQKALCTQRVWEHLAYLAAPYKEQYDREQQANAEQLTDAKKRKQDAKEQTDKLEEQIGQLRASVVNTDNVKEAINLLLRDAGFQGFHLEKHPVHDNAYQVIRADRSIAENLSEGERNFIAFLYFYFLVKGSLDESGDTRGKVVVIDDPVSSMDSSAIFIVAAHIRELVSICENNVEYRHNEAKGDYIKQIIILTHNAYFFKEVSNRYLNDYSYASYYLINKENNVSSITLCVERPENELSHYVNYSPVINSYATLWKEYSEVRSPVTLLNVARQILEHYFIQLTGHTDEDLTTCILENNRERFITTREDGTEDQSRLHLIKSLLSYIRIQQHGIHDETYYVVQSHNADQIRRVFKLIFTLMNQEQHYNMMAKVSPTMSDQTLEHPVTESRE